MFKKAFVEKFWKVDGRRYRQNMPGVQLWVSDQKHSEVREDHFWDKELSVLG